MNIYLFWILFLALWAIVPLMIIKGRDDESPKIQTTPEEKGRKKGGFSRNSLLFIIILISLEIVRELPITLILRPFNFETFATTAYISASEDLLEAAAVPSLFLILIASFFIIITSKYILRESDD